MGLDLGIVFVGRRLATGFRLAAVGLCGRVFVGRF